MKQLLDKVLEFHKAFSLPMASSPTADIQPTLYTMRHKIQAEENDEYKSACDDKDLIEIADALGDQLYVLCGTIITHGLQDKIVEVFEEIHRSNMSKL